MAASVLLAVVVAGGLWLSAPGPSLAADVVTHMRAELLGRQKEVALEAAHDGLVVEF